MDQARDTASGHDQHAKTLAKDIETTWDQTYTYRLGAHTVLTGDHDQIRVDLHATAAATERADADTARRRAGLDAVEAELAHRDHLRPDVARAVDTARIHRHAQRIEAAEQHSRAEAARIRRQDNDYGLGPGHGPSRGPGLGR